MNNNKQINEKGITLIALIITIIILIILAAVSIRAAFNSGIIEYSINGTEKYKREAENENKIISNLQNMMESVLSKLGSTENNNVEQKEYTALFSNGEYAYVLKKTGELYGIIENEGWITFNENNATKVQDNFFVKENRYHGLEFLCLTSDDRLFNYYTNSYIENIQNIQSWCGEYGHYFITKNDDIYWVDSGEIIAENVDLKSWLFPLSGYAYFKTQNNDLYFINGDTVIDLHSNMEIDELYDNLSFLSGDDLYFFDGDDIILSKENVDIKRWLSNGYFITNSNDIYRFEIVNGIVHICVNDVDVKTWYGGSPHNGDPGYYVAQDNNLYMAYTEGELFAENTSIKEWYGYADYFITQDNDLYKGNGTLIAENVNVRGFINWDTFIIDDNLYYVNHNNQLVLIIENINFDSLYGNSFYFTKDGSLCSYNGTVMAENVVIKEWYDFEGFYLTQDNCLYQDNTIISNDCKSFDVETKSYYTLNDELVINFYRYEVTG